MAPKRAKRKAGAAAVAAPEPAAPSPLQELPPDVARLLGVQLLRLDKINSVETASRDIASLAQTCSSLNSTAQEVLWEVLGEHLTAEEAPKGKGLAVVPRAERYEALWLDCKTQRLEKDPAPKQVAQEYEEDVPEHVPEHVYAEVRRLRCLGLAATNAKKEFLLAEGDLKDLPRVDKSRGALGTVHAYRLADVLTTARAKHGSVEGMAEAGRVKAAASTRRKQSSADAAQGRRADLAAALAAEGGTLTDSMAKVGPVAAHIRGGKGAPPRSSLLPFLRLADWAQKHGGYSRFRQELVTSESRFMGFKVCMRDEMQDGGYYGSNYFGAAQKACANPSNQEEEEVVRLACQVWARGKGGLTAALASPDMPPAGTPLRAAVEAALRQRMVTSVPVDLYYDNEWDEEEQWGHQEGQEEAAPPDVPSGQVAAFLSHGFQQYIQVEVSAASPQDLAAWQGRVQGKLPWLAGIAGSYTGAWLADACLHPFIPPPGVQPEQQQQQQEQAQGATTDSGAGGGADGGKQDVSDGSGGGSADAHKAVFFVGLEEKQAPASLGLSSDGRDLDPGAGPSRRPQPPQAEDLQSALLRSARRWPQYKQGMQARLALLDAVQLPEWVVAPGGATEAAV